MAPKQVLHIPTLVNESGCFDLQFRKDTRHERTNSPTYYRWKVQFVITLPKEHAKTLEKVQKAMSCGKVHLVANQARFSVQKLDEISETIVPFFRKNKLVERKKRDFELWQKAVEIIGRNKGKYLSGWKRNDLLTLIEIQKSNAKYKSKPKQPKWLDMAQALAKTS